MVNQGCQFNFMSGPENHPKLSALYTKKPEIWPKNKLLGPKFRLLPENWHPGNPDSTKPYKPHWLNTHLFAHSLERVKNSLVVGAPVTTEDCCWMLVLLEQLTINLTDDALEWNKQKRQQSVKDVPLTTRRAQLLYKVYGDSTLLVLNRTSLNSDSALLALNWWKHHKTIWHVSLLMLCMGGSRILI